MKYLLFGWHAQSDSLIFTHISLHNGFEISRDLNETSAISPPRPVLGVLGERGSGGEGWSSDMQASGSVICSFFENVAARDSDGRGVHCTVDW